MTELLRLVKKQLEEAKEGPEDALSFPEHVGVAFAFPPGTSSV